MKQALGDNRCLAIVAAMITKTAPREFEMYCDHKPPYSEFEFAQFLFTKGMSCSMGIRGEEFYSLIDVTDSESKNPPEFLKQLKETLNKDTKVTISFTLGTYPAVFSVRSEGNPKDTHAIFWDGEKVHDPNPLVLDGRRLDEYEILSYFPILAVPR